MSRLSIAVRGLAAVAMFSVAIPAVAAPGGALSGQNLTNNVGTTNLPTDANSINANSIGANSIGGGGPGGALPMNELGDATSGVPLTEGADPAKWNLKTGLGGPILIAGDVALKSKGYQGGLAAQGVDTNQITEPLAFQGVMPSQGGLMPSQVGAELPASVTNMTSLFHLSGPN